MTYTLKDGSTLSREYSSVPIFLDELDKEGSVTQLADQFRVGDMKYVGIKVRNLQGASPL